VDTVGAECRRPISGLDGAQCGKTPPQCPTTEAPGPYFQKGFFHNGYIKSLKQLVHFYNTRDLFSFDVTIRTLPARNHREGGLLARPEVPQNIDCTTGNLGLDGPGGGPDRRVPADPLGRVHDTLPRRQHTIPVLA
jgi:hypothetical protein